MNPPISTSKRGIPQDSPFAGLTNRTISERETDTEIGFPLMFEVSSEISGKVRIQLRAIVGIVAAAQREFDPGIVSVESRGFPAAVFCVVTAVDVAAEFMREVESPVETAFRFLQTGSNSVLP